MKWLGLMAACLVVGCSNLHGPVEGQSTARDHVIAVDWDGNYYPLPSNDAARIDSRASFHALKHCYTQDKCGQPQEHGAFDDCTFSFWERSYWWQ